MLCRLQAPSKTFLIGEYAILDGGEAILASTQPRFEMIIESPGEGSAAGIHRNSPAGKWIRNHPSDFTSVKMRFIDPHEEAGGFGASGAQFLFVNLWSQIQNQNLQSLMSNLSIDEIWKDFRSFYADLPQKQKPSGADIISQWKGRLTAVCTSPFSTQELEWGFKELEFSLVRTNEKIQTHTHLQDLGAVNFAELKTLSSEAVEALKSKNEEAFLNTVLRYSQELARLNLVAFPTQERLNRIKTHSSILASKGCGAMGADVLALFYRPEHRAEVKAFVSNLGLNTVATSEEISEGLQISVDVNSSPEKTPAIQANSDGELLQ